MSKSPAFDIQGLRKVFHLPAEHHASLRARFVNMFRPNPLRTFVAVDDLTLQIHHGEFFGIVGRNGSGKSTLLKMLAGIFQPSSGTVTVHGAVSPFLELGVGFSPELTARENIFLNGAVLGMEKADIEQRYADIITFAELETFQDMKLKNFSSGMYVRLAFSVAIHAPSDILLMDEVLAVGDERFQEKCKAVFRGLKEQGKTVVLVSHDMHAIESFCDRVLVMEAGKPITIGTPAEAVGSYHALNASEQVSQAPMAAQTPEQIEEQLPAVPQTRKLESEEEERTPLQKELKETRAALHNAKMALQRRQALIVHLSQQVQEYNIVKLSLSYKIMRFHGAITMMIRHPLRTLNDIGLAFALLRREGLGSFFKRLKAYFQGHRLPSGFADAGLLEEEAYGEYMAREMWDGDTIEDFETLCAKEKNPPIISILVPVYNISADLLHRCVDSVKKQLYPHWELCLYDDGSTNPETREALTKLENTDPRIKVRLGEKNQNISGASNEALKMATGTHIGLLDHDDELHPLALAEVVKVILLQHPDLIYTDEDFMDMDGKRFSPHFKPDFSPDLLLSHNYITHFLVFTQELAKKQPELFRLGVEGAQDHDLILRLTEQTKNIVHIPKVLYHWRYMETSTSKNPHSKPEAIIKARKVLEDALQRRHIEGEVLEGNAPYYFRVKRKIQGNPLVSIVIPFKDLPKLLEMSVESVLHKSTYKNFEIIGVSNNSSDPATFAMMKRLEAMDSRVRFVEYNVPFNYADINNYAVQNFVQGEHVVLMNNDIEIITPDWIEAMLEHSQRPEVGVVGAKLYYPNDTVQHAGVVIGIGGTAGHAYKNLDRQTMGYFNRANIIHDVSAVTAALLMVKKSLYDQMHGLDGEHLKVAFNDVDFCARILEAGYWNIFTPFAEAYHHESISRGYEDTPEKKARFAKESDFFMRRHKELLKKGDPFYSPHLSLHHEDYRLKQVYAFDA